MIFEEKYFSCYTLLTDQILLSHCLYLLRYWTIYVLKLFVVQSVTSYVFKINHSFLIEPIFYITKKLRQSVIISRMKSFLTWNKKHFSSFLKDFQLSEIASDPRVNLQRNSVHDGSVNWFLNWIVRIYELWLCKWKDKAWETCKRS